MPAARRATRIQPARSAFARAGLTAGEMPTPAEIARFLSHVKIEQRLPLNHAVKGPCWAWKSGSDDKGYGSFKWRGLRVWAHRFSYEVFRVACATADACGGGALAMEGMEVDHACYHPDCVNPAHLSLKTPARNRGETRRWKPDPGLDPVFAAAALPEKPQDDIPF